MVKVVFVKKESFIKGFTISGHSGYAQEGEDIVCSAVSAVAYTAVGALIELAGLNCYIENDGYMKCSIPDNVPSEKMDIVKTIMETTWIGIKQIENSYQQYVKVNEEVQL